MKSIFRVFLLLIALPCSAQNWQQLSDFPGVARDDGAAFIIGDTAYFGTGLTPWWAPTSDFYGFDLSTETWFSVAALPNSNERQYAAAFSDSSQFGFIFGGHDGTNFLNDLWRYDPSSNNWLELSPLPAEGRGGAACFVFNDTAYVVGGKNAQNEAFDEVWAYSMSSDSWVQKNDLPFGGRWRSSVAQLNGLGYLVFGKDENGTFRNELFEYDPTLDSWTNISTFPSLGRSHATLFPFGSNLYCAFGIDSLNNSHNDLWSYDILSNTWNSLPGLPSIGRRGGMTVATENGVYYTTGIDEANVRLTETWKYHPSLTIDEANDPEQPKTIVKVVDLLGRETNIESNQVFIYVYSDGTTQKVFRVE